MRIVLQRVHLGVFAALMILVNSVVASNQPESKSIILLGGTANSSIEKVVIDTDRNQYLLGSFVNPGTCTIGTNVFTSTTLGSGLVAKISPEGEVLWARQILPQVVCSDLKMDSNGNLLILGQAVGSPTFFNHTFNTANPTSMFLLKISNDGDYVWAKVISASSYTSGKLLEMTPDGSALVVGRFRGTFSISTSTGGVTLSESFNLAGFLLRISEAGTITTAVQLSLGPLDPASMVLSDSGSIYLAGSFQNTLTIGSTNITSVNATDSFLAKFNSDTSLSRLWQIGGTNNVTPGFVCLNGQEIILSVSANGSVKFGTQNVYVGNNKCFHVLRFTEDQATASTYSSEGATMAAGSGYLIGSDLLLHGNFSGTAIFGGTNIVSNASSDGFFGLLTPQNTWRWVVSGGGVGSDVFRGSTRHQPTRQLFLCGTMTTGSLFGNAVTAPSSGVGFVARLAFPAPPSVLHTRVGDSLMLMWPGDTDSYQLESADDLGSSWEVFATSPTNADGTNTVAIPTTETARFFRLALP